jgi:antitoxin HicB
MSWKKYVVNRLHQLMSEHNISKTDLSIRLNTSRMQVDRILDPKDEGMTLDTLIRICNVFGRELKLSLIDEQGVANER